MGAQSHIPQERVAIGCRPRAGRRLRAVAGVVVAFAALCLSLIGADPARAEPVSGDISVDLSAGYARLVFHFSDQIDADVRLANNVLVISFKTPVNVSVDHLASDAPGYIGAARRDPDRTAVRMAVSQHVRVNSIMAAERLFVDLLPDSWTAAPPPLPREVVEDLARRARAAEKRQREEASLARERTIPLTIVRVAHQPTFSRYVFELPELMSITNERGKDKLTLVFDRTLKFDLASAVSPLPPTIESITSTPGDQTTSVSFALIGKVDVRTFREDNNYVVDIMRDLDGRATPSALLPPAPNHCPARRPHWLQAAPAPSAPPAKVAAPQMVPAQQATTCPRPRPLP